MCLLSLESVEIHQGDVEMERRCGMHSAGQQSNQGIIGNVCHAVRRSSSRRQGSQCRGKDQSCRRYGMKRKICDSGQCLHSSRLVGSEIESMAIRDCMSQCREQIEAASVSKDIKTNSGHHFHCSLKIEVRRVGYLPSYHELRLNWLGEHWCWRSHCLRENNKVPKRFFAPFLHCVMRTADSCMRKQI